MWYFLDINTNTQTISVGIAGAGVWAGRVHVPAIQADPRFRITGIWSRRPEQTAEFAARFGLEPIADFADLIEASSVIDLAVPPAVQPTLALEAAARGRQHMLEKPVGMDGRLLEQLRMVVAERRLSARVFVTRFFDAGRLATLNSLAAEPWTRARSEWRSGAFLPGSPFAVAWRDADAVLYDIGPHAISQLEAILGPVGEGRMVASTPTSIALELRHVGGAQSEVFVDVGADVPALEEELTLWVPGVEHHPVLETVDPRRAFGQLLDRLAADISGTEVGIDDGTDPTRLADGIRMVTLLGDLAASRQQPVAR